jgi:rod shape-determining protein MreC
LHSQTKINAKIKKSHHYGSLSWNGKNFTKVLLEDLPIQANIKKGDTIISGGKSIFFPEGIPIGTISDFKIDNKAYNSITINLFTDMSALYNVYIVKNNQKEELIELEKQSSDE